MMNSYQPSSTERYNYGFQRSEQCKFCGSYGVQGEEWIYQDPYPSTRFMRWCDACGSIWQSLSPPKLSKDLLSPMRVGHGERP